MEHRLLREISAIADVHPDTPRRERRMSQDERLECWAAALEQQGARCLRPLERVEFLSARERQLLRADDSPLSVAFDNPALRAEGLRSDRFGDAAAFFNLSEWQMHSLLCDCHYLGQMPAAEVARRVRVTARPARSYGMASFAVCAATLGAVPAIALLLSVL